jgi:myosin heavy subunit
LFAIGSSAYSKMMKDSMDQVIIISGESGAGKTGNFSKYNLGFKNKFIFVF